MANFSISEGTGEQFILRGNSIPTNIVREDLLSNTSEAYNCYVNQQFSALLQTYMVNYVISISGYYSVYS